jgi:hypothetical protein
MTSQAEPAEEQAAAAKPNYWSREVARHSDAQVPPWVRSAHTRIRPTPRLAQIRILCKPAAGFLSCNRLGKPRWV